MAKLFKRECHKCYGSGFLPHYAGIYNGQCFKCNGNGYFAVKTDPAILDARNAKAAEKRAAKKEAERQAHIKRSFWRNIANGIRHAVWAAENEAAKAAAEAIVDGKQIITGEIISTKWVDEVYCYGQRILKMVVKDDRGFKVWGTVPRSIIEANDDALKGQRVTFSATVQASKDDDKFGFFKRPTKAAIAATN